MSNKTKEAQNDEEEKHYRKKILTYTKYSNSNVKSNLNDNFKAQK